MITRLDKLQGRNIYENTALAKLNEVIDAVNEFQKILHDIVNESVKNMSWVDTLENTVLELRAKVNKLAPNINFDQPEVKENVQDKFAEQRKWIGKVCWFWDDDNTNSSCGILTSIDTETFKEPQFVCNDEYDYEHCKPVKPDDSIIYKGV